jgi:hypothetical protein
VNTRGYARIAKTVVGLQSVSMAERGASVWSVMVQGCAFTRGFGIHAKSVAVQVFASTIMSAADAGSVGGQVPCAKGRHAASGV